MRGAQMVGRGLRPRRGELALCCLVALASLAVAAAVHRFAPGFGIVFKPLLWPLLVLPFAVRPRYALVTSFAVPLLSCALTGMPSLPVALALSCGSTVFTVLLLALVRKVGGGLWPPRTCNAANPECPPYPAGSNDGRARTPAAPHTQRGGPGVSALPCGVERW